MTESILLNDPFVVLLFRNVCKNKKPGDRLAHVSPGVMRSRQLKLDPPYRWYSVRRGGATHAYRDIVVTFLPFVCVDVGMLSRLPVFTLLTLLRNLVNCN